MTSAVPARSLSGPAELEHLLGDPTDPDSRMSYAKAAELDRDERFPEEACRLLDTLGLPRHYVPAALGGSLERYDDLIGLLRVVSRRDLTVTVAHAKTFLGAASVWVAGDPVQARALAATVAAGVPVSWGLTERTHGSDLLSSAVTASPVACGGFRVNGEKWPINNATRGELICLLVRTSPAGGSRGFSVVLVDKRKLARDTVRALPKVHTHGIRGADISGVAFTDAVVPATALVGGLGKGVEVVLRALQLTRTVCTGLSLGVADQALRQAWRFADHRIVYGRRLADVAHVRRTLGEACAQLLCVEAVAVVAGRAVHTLTDEMSIVSAVAKSFVPSLVDELVGGCASVLGARAVLTEVFEHGAFAKLERDHRIVGIFDGNTFVNQSVVINQFPLLARRYQAESVREPGVRDATDLCRRLAEPDLGRLTVLSRHGCSVVQALPDAVRQLSRFADAVPPRVVRLAEDLRAVCDRLHEDLAVSPPAPTHAVTQSSFALAQRFEWCFAGAAALRLWLANRDRAAGDPLWTDAVWLDAVLTLVISRVSPGTEDRHQVYERLPDVMGLDRPPATTTLFRRFTGEFR